MPIDGRLKSVEKVIKSAAAITALLPGIATLLGLVQIPPSIGSLVTFINVFVGLACLIVTMLLSDYIKSMRGSLVAMLVFGLAITGAIASTSYYIFANRHILEVSEFVDKSGLIIVPAYPSDEIRQIVANFSNDYVDALESSSQNRILKNLIDRNNWDSIVILVVLLLIAQAASISAIVLGAWKLSFAASAK